MAVLGLDHVNIEGPPSLIEACRRFYVDVVGLREGARPPFRSRGFWLYAGEVAVVHLSERDVPEAVQESGPFAHFALLCTGLEAAAERLQRHGVPFERDGVPATGHTQLFLHDPAGWRWS
ncbi:MAG: VOC family protein [Acidobacteriota bacterium]